MALPATLGYVDCVGGINIFCFFPLLCHERVGCADGTVKKKSCIIFSINISLLRSGGYIIINLTIRSSSQIYISIRSGLWTMSKRWKSLHHHNTENCYNTKVGRRASEYEIDPDNAASRRAYIQ